MLSIYACVYHAHYVYFPVIIPPTIALTLIKDLEVLRNAYIVLDRVRPGQSPNPERQRPVLYDHFDMFSHEKHLGRGPLIFV